MKSLYLRIYATVVVVLLLFALVSGWVVERHLDQERSRTEQVVSDRLGAWAELLERSLPGGDAPAEDQAAALRDWSQRLRVPLALDDVKGERIAASESFLRRSTEGPGKPYAFKLDDGRTLWTMRPGGFRQRGVGPRGGDAPGGDERAGRMMPPPAPWPLLPPGMPRGTGLAIVLVVLFIARRGRCLSGRASPDAPARGAQARRRAVWRRRAQPSRRDQRPATRFAAGRDQLQRRCRAGRGAGTGAPVAARQCQPRAALAAGRG
jgi:hypothetical protein